MSPRHSPPAFDFAKMCKRAGAHAIFASLPAGSTTDVCTGRNRVPVRGAVVGRDDQPLNATAMSGGTPSGGFNCSTFQPTHYSNGIFGNLTGFPRTSKSVDRKALTNGNETTLTPRGVNTAEGGGSLHRQMIQIGAHIIHQFRADHYPVQIVFDHGVGNHLHTAAGTAVTISGVVHCLQRLQRRAEPAAIP